jgi:hypothetical protein
MVGNIRQKGVVRQERQGHKRGRTCLLTSEIFRFVSKSNLDGYRKYSTRIAMMN